MTGDLLAIVPPNNTGSDVLTRYHFQAHLAFPYCLDCYSGENIQSVFFEHFEDILIQYSDSWHMMQVKTKDRQLGEWRLSETLGKSGGIRSLFRTYNAVKHYNVTFGLYIEGLISSNDDLNKLTLSNRDITQELIERISRELATNPDDVSDFLQRLKVVPNIPSRDSIADRNLRILGSFAKNRSYTEVEEIYRNYINEACQAMEGNPLLERIIFILNPNQDDSKVLEREIAEKRFSRDRLQAIFGESLDKNLCLLKRITDPQKNPPSNLELKLLAGGADDQIIDDAKTLRANASIKIAEITSMDLYNDENPVEDLELRLKTIASAIIQKNMDKVFPARDSWSEILEHLEKYPNTSDPNRLFRRDPFLLLGYICELSDRCIVHWGVPIA